MTRRDWVTAGGLGFLAACGRRKGTGYPGFALIALAGDSSITAIDLTAFRFTKSIQLDAPAAFVLSGIQGVSYALTPSNGTVSLIDSNLNKVNSRRLAPSLADLRLLPDGKRLVATAMDLRELIEADAVTLNVLGRHKLQDRPGGVEISPLADIAVISENGAALELFTMNGARRSSTSVKGRIGSVRFRADGKLLLVANTEDRSITVLSVPELQIVADLPLAMQPENLCFTPDGGQLFVSGDGLDAVAIMFPYHTLEIEQTVLAGRDPGVMACSNNPGYLFVASHSGSDVTILNVETRKVIGLVQVGARPRFVAVTPDDQYALVLDEGSGDVAIIHIGAIRANRMRSGAALFTVLPVGDKPVHCAIVPRQL